MSSKEKKKKEDLDKTKKYKMKADKKRTKAAKKNDPKRKAKKKKIMIVVAIIILILLGAFAGLFFGLFGDDFKISQEELLINYANSQVLDAKGNQVASLSGDQNRKIISMSDMSEYLPKAFVSIEDERFYKHHGVDIKRTAAAVVSYIAHGGKSGFGGSTITQQLVKNITNDKKDSPIRKIKEMSKAYQIEKLASKDQILELYLNIIFLGGNTHGVEVASEYYFDKPAKELDLAESAFLAGITHMPNNYDPFDEDKDNSERTKTRTKTVLSKMLELGYVTQEQYDEAVKEVESGLNFKEGKVTQNIYSYHTEATINQILNQLVEEKKWDREYAKLYLYGGGLTIYSTQDTSIQETMEDEFEKDKYQVSSKKTKGDHSQAAMVIIDHKNGNVLGTVGGLGEKKDAFGLNRATQSTRQTGSAMKPLSVYAPAIEQGIITAGTVYDDAPTTFAGNYTPKNYYSGYKGPSTVRYALEISQNIIPIKIMTKLGPGESIKFLESIGITSLKKSDETLSLALGGLTDGVSPLEMAAGYAAIANDGVYIEPTFYTKVVDSKGKTVLEPKQEKKKVMSESNAYIMKDLLTQPVKGSEGTATYCAISGMDVAAKTGTTNDDFDRWLCGFTPYYTAATWFGYDQNEEVRYSGNPAGKIWDAIMTSIHKELEGRKFTKPGDIVTASICKDSGLLAKEGCNAYTEIFVSGTAPKKTCNASVKLTICAETGKIANEYCPDKITKTYASELETEKNAPWKTEGAGKGGNVPTEICDVHKKPEEKKLDEEKPKENKTNNTNTNTSNTNDNGIANETNEVDPSNTVDNSTGGNEVTPPTNDTTE